jgi:phospholipid/cholesterol/gamma-HCH transport system permease protein
MTADWEISAPGGEAILHPHGDWVVLEMGDATRKVPPNERPEHVNFSRIGKVDTAGALCLAKLLSDDAQVDFGDRDDISRLFDLVRAPVEDSKGHVEERFPFFARLGKQLCEIGSDIYEMLVFTGHMVFALGRVAANLRRLRLTPLIAMMQDAGINALPIAFIMTFFIGAVIALVGTNLLTTLGVEVFTVQLVGVAILREFGVVIAAILFAGRSASAFAAQIGSMRMNQETDAMQVMGIDRFEALIVPRILAGVMMMPLMTFIADLGGIVGGLVVSWATIGIQPTFFVQRFSDTVSISHFWIGLCKAPFLGLVIAASGSRHGMMVEGDVQSLGRHVTSAVVQSVFMIIMFDAVFAVIFMVLDL